MADEEVCTWRLRFHEEREERERIEHKLKMVK